MVKRKKKIGKEKKGNRKKDLWIRRSEGIKLLRCWRDDRKKTSVILETMAMAKLVAN